MTKEKYLLTTKYIAKLLLSLQNGTETPVLPEDITLAELHFVSSKHSLSAAAYTALRDVIKTSDIPDEYKQKWAREAEIATVQHIRHTAAFAEVTNAFTAAAVPFLPIKGFLLKALWTKPEFRTMADMDIVVEGKCFDKAKDALLSLGYKLDHRGDVHDSFLKNGNINIELHRILYTDATETFSDWMPKQENPYWYEMSYEDLFVFILRHAYKHYEAGGCGLRTVFDFYLLFDKYGRAENNSVLMEKIERAELYPFYLIVTKLVDSWFLDKSAEDSYESELFVATGGVYGTLDNHVSYSVNKRGKSGHFINRLFPPVKVIYSRYKWTKKCPILLPIGYLVRFVTAIFDRKTFREIESLRKLEK